MSILSKKRRHLARKMLKHGLHVVPSDRLPWAIAMQNELVNIEDDREAFAWARGCVYAYY